MLNEKVTEILNLMNDHPELPVLPMVGTEIVADDCYARWCASWGSAEIQKVCIVNERVVFWDEDYIWETWEEIGFDYDDFGINDEIPDEDAEKIAREVLERLEWVEVIVVNIDSPDDIIPDNTRIFDLISKEVSEV